MIAKALGAISERDWARFCSHVTRSEGCWEWQAAKSLGGYGQFWLNRRPTRAHRVAWARVNGDLAPGVQIDHLCRNAGCVNPAHMEPVSPQVNSARAAAVKWPLGATCANGHAYSIAGSYPRAGTDRPTCKQCKRDVAKRCYAKKNGTNQ